MLTAFHGQERCHRAQAIVLNGHNRNRYCCCSAICLVAFRYAIASDHRLIINQPHRDNDDQQGSAAGRAVGRYLKFSRFPFVQFQFPPKTWPRSFAGLFLFGKVSGRTISSPGGGRAIYSDVKFFKRLSREK